MDLVSRVQGILLKPKEEWEKIKPESTSVKELFTSYAMILAAIPAIAGFIGMGLIGRRIPFYGWFRYNLGTALLYAIFYYILSLVAAYVFGIVINALASTFESKTDTVKAMKTSIYSMTPVWVAGVLFIFPFLNMLAWLASLYAIYVLYLGLSSSIMSTPKDKVVPYTVVSIVACFVLLIIITVILGAIFAVGAVGRI